VERNHPTLRKEIKRRKRRKNKKMLGSDPAA
jgi:hypothetical protein